MSPMWATSRATRTRIFSSVFLSASSHRRGYAVDRNVASERGEFPGFQGTRSNPTRGFSLMLNVRFPHVLSSALRDQNWYAQLFHLL